MFFFSSIIILVNYDQQSIIFTEMGSIAFLVLCSIAHLAIASVTNPACSGSLNTKAIVTEEPRLVNTVPNGKRFTVGEGYDQINIVHVYGGTPYDMGLAFGKLMSKELNELIPEYFKYLEAEVEQIIKILPPVNLEIFYFSSL